MKILQPDVDLDAFFERLASADQCALLLDYDGTLAPFQVRRDRALPYAGIIGALNDITSTKRTHLALITGRAIRDRGPRLDGLGPLPEIWGCHGWERRRADGTLQQVDLPESAAEELAEARRWAESNGIAECCEFKASGIALHWRGLAPQRQRELRDAARAGWLRDDVPGNAPRGEPPHASDTVGLELREFDGGIELRAAGTNKGDAVRRMLSHHPASVVVAYAGDDQTDEDAFEAVRDRGLGILVRTEPRPTSAHIWLRPPDELLSFLTRWRKARESLA